MEESGPEDPPPEPEPDGDQEPVDYALIAYQWAEANLLGLNTRCNDAIAVGHATLLIPAGDLPHPDSWPDVCVELTRNGFTEAVVQADGVLVTIPK